MKIEILEDENMMNVCPKCGVPDGLECIQLLMYRDGVQVENEISIHCKKCGLSLVEEKKHVPSLPQK